MNWHHGMPIVIRDVDADTKKSRIRTQLSEISGIKSVAPCNVRICKAKMGFFSLELWAEAHMRSFIQEKKR